MSLLLDALKKAAQDKIARSDFGAHSDPQGEGQDGPRHKIASSDSGARSDPNGGHQDDRDATPDEAKSSAASARISKHASEQEDGADTSAEEFEFTLDEAPAIALKHRADHAHSNSPRISNAAIDSEPVKKSVSAETASIAAMHTTVTDEALQLLIHKSNAEQRKRRYLVWGSVISGSLIILMLAGLYFYLEMEDEIIAMQSKNRQALAALAAQTKIEEHLTSLATPVAKPVHMNHEMVKRTLAPRPSVEQKARPKQTFTVQKSEKRDPINVLLNRGWSSFQRGEYDSASKAYMEVLQREAHNRDALLGIAAVAGKRGETEQARDTYLKLLQLDPLDPYAHAGLASIAQTEGASLSENRLKQLIEKQPDGAHLHFVLGNLYAQEHKWPQAQQAYFSAWQGDSENADYAFNLAVSLDHLKKYSEAMRFYQSSIDLAQNRKTGFSVDAVEQRLQQLRVIEQ